jgi:hypothetical protein
MPRQFGTPGIEHWARAAASHLQPGLVVRRLPTGVTSLLGVNGHMWAGCDDGRVVVWEPAPGALAVECTPGTKQV